MKHLVPLVTLISSSAFAGTIIVPSEAPSISVAVEKALAGDTILVSPGVYNEMINFRGKAITIESAEGFAKTTIDVQGAGSAAMFVMGENNKSVLKGFTLTGGIGTEFDSAILGGGMFLHNSSPTIIDCHIVNNHAEWGGGIHNLGSSPRIINCIIEGNSAELNGGGMRSHEWSQPYVENCTITNNIGMFGGGMDFVADSVPTIVNCELVGNGAYFQGGAIYVGCDCSSPNIAETQMCLNVPDHVVGGWNNNGNNSLCEICEADVTRDGVVGIQDILEVISHWGPGACLADITGEGGVDVNDLLVVINAWGECS